MKPGDEWVYEETSDGVTEGGEIIEDTDDWYAQDSQGNIWYLGEKTAEYDKGKVVTTAGSWEHGVDGALAGIAVPANPQPGMSYRQEYYKGQAEDRGTVLSIEESAFVPVGEYHDVLMTRDTTPLHPDILEYKFYAKGIGIVMEVSVTPQSGRGVLVKKTG